MKKTKLLSELRVALEQGLRENGHTKTSKIQVSFDGGVISITGTVKSYYQKQMVFSIVNRIGKGAVVRDCLTVG